MTTIDVTNCYTVIVVDVAGGVHHLAFPKENGGSQKATAVMKFLRKEIGLQAQKQGPYYMMRPVKAKA